MRIRSSWRGWRSWRALAAGAVALLGLALLLTGPTAVVYGWNELSERHARAETERRHLGVTVRDGPVAFVVHDVACGAETLGRSRALGHFCLVKLSARNEGAKPLKVRETTQRAYGATGARYIPDSAATRYANADGDPFGALAPGATRTGTIVFDVPPAAGITQVEVHATVYSRGARVAVTTR